MRLALLFLLAAWGGLHAQSVEDEIRAEVGRYIKAVNSGNARTLADLYVRTPGVSSVRDGGIARGWSEILKLVEDLHRQAGRITMRVDSVAVAPLGNDAGVAFFPYSWTLGARTGARTLRGAMTLVYERTRQGWRVVHDHTSTLRGPEPGRLPAVRRDSLLTGPVRGTEPCVVSRIIDGDTFECDTGLRVRLIGIDTPELSQAPYGAQAAQALAALMPVATAVELERDVQPTDRYGRLLAYVWRDTLMINWAMVRNGWAVLLTYPPNVQYVERLQEAQRSARDEGVGLWAVGGFDCPPSERRRGRCE